MQQFQCKSDLLWGIGNESFSQCTNLSSVTIPDSVTFIDEGAFMSCSKLSSITIPDAVTAIGPAAFAGCSGIKTITIPDKVEEIGCGAFMNCTGLQSITFDGDAPDFLLETADGEYMEESNTFHKVTATAYYPINNPTWTSDVMKQYYGTITWVPYGDTTEEPDIAGYSAGLSTTTPTATTGEKVYVSVAVDHTEETTFNAGELVFTYDPARLSFNQTNSTLGNATVKTENGTLTLEDYGAAKNCGNGI